GASARQIRICHQPQDRDDTRLDGAANSDRARRRGDRIIWPTSESGTPGGPINHAGECPNPSASVEAGPSNHRRGDSYRIPVRHTGSVIYFTFDALKIMVSSQAD